MKIYSWNINGLRAVLKKGALQDFIANEQPDVLCLQEIKANPSQIDYDFAATGYQVFWNPAARPGYSGTAVLVKNGLSISMSLREQGQASSRPLATNGEPDERLSPVTTGAKERVEKEPVLFSDAIRDIAISEGRITVLEFPQFYLINVYTPNSKPDLSRLQLRHDSWDPGFLELLKNLEKNKPIVTCGDFNAAHEEIDIARPKTNHKSAGFTDEERQGITNLISAGFVDTFRMLNPEAQRYTWWSHWGHARENNVGWRIDYFFISSSLRKNLKSAEIYEAYAGSDHCPVSIDLEFR